MINKIESEITTHTPLWLSWKEVKEKYPNKWLLLGCKGIGQLENNELDVLGVADSFDEINEFDNKHHTFFWKTKQYDAFCMETTKIIEKTKKLVFPAYTTITIK